MPLLKWRVNWVPNADSDWQFFGWRWKKTKAIKLEIRASFKVLLSARRMGPGFVGVEDHSTFQHWAWGVWGTDWVSYLLFMFSFFLWPSATHTWPSLLLHGGAVIILVFNVFPIHRYQKKGKRGSVAKCLQTCVFNGSWPVGAGSHERSPLASSRAGLILLAALLQKLLQFYLCGFVFYSHCLLPLLPGPSLLFSMRQCTNESWQQ